MIYLKNVEKRYKDKVIYNNFSYKFDDKGLYFITGKSGTGKTTLLNLIGGIIKPSNGTIIYENIDSIYLDSYYSYQDFNLFSKLTVFENIKLIANIKKKTFDENYALDVLDKIGIKELKDHLANELSGGERQRLSIAIALILNTKVLILDEPTSSLDESNKKIIINLIRDISKDILVIISTHDLELINSSDNVIDVEHNNYSSDSIIIDKPIKKQKKIDLNFKAFAIKHKLMQKQIIRRIFQVVLFSIVVILGTFLYPLANINEETVSAREITKTNNFVMIDLVKHKTAKNLINNGATEVYRFSLYPTNVSIPLSEEPLVDCVIIDNSLQDYYINISSFFRDKLYFYGFNENRENIHGKELKTQFNSYYINEVIDVQKSDYHSDFYPHKAVFMNLKTYLSTSSFSLNYSVYSSSLKVSSELKKGQIILSKQYMDGVNNSYNSTYNYELNKNCDFNISFTKSSGIENYYIIDINDKNNYSYISEEDYMNIYTKYNIYNNEDDSFLSEARCAYINLTNYDDTVKLLKDLKKDNIGYYFDKTLDCKVVTGYFEALSSMVLAIIPIALVILVFLSLYLSYNMLKLNEHTFDCLYLCGVSKMSVYQICLTDLFISLLCSVIVSIYPIIKFDKAMQKFLTDREQYISVTYQFFDIKYTIISIVLSFVLVLLFIVLQISMKKHKSTFIN